MRRAISFLVLVALTAFPGVLAAHEGHAHHVMGIVSAIDANRIEVKDSDGQLVACQLNAETKYMRGDRLVTEPGIKIGERVMVETVEESGKAIARIVRLGETGQKPPAQ